MHPRGNDYLNTFAHLLNYDALAECLIGLGIPRPDEAFIDLGCGTGNLLESLSRQTNQPLIGVDSEISQLEVARQTAPLARYILADFFDLPATMLSTSKCSSAIAHLGFAFMNTLTSDLRLSLLLHLAEHSQLARLAFEIQNEDDQDKYQFGIWYETCFPSGLVLRTRSERRIGARELTLLFHTDTSDWQDTVQIYPWALEQCAGDLLSTGWQLDTHSPAMYRHGNHQSHWLCICTRATRIECTTG